MVEDREGYRDEYPMKHVKLIWAVVGIAGVFLLLLGSAGIVTMLSIADDTNTTVTLIRDDQKNNTTRNKQIKSLAEDIESCTTPEGECYKRSQQNQGAAIGAINDFNLLLAVCQKKPDVNTVQEFKTCVQDKMLTEGDK